MRGVSVICRNKGQRHSHILRLSILACHAQSNSSHQLSHTFDHVSSPPVCPTSYLLISNKLTIIQRLGHVPQDSRDRHRTSLRQMRRQVSCLRQLRASDYPCPYLRRMFLRQLPEQMRCLRWRGMFALIYDYLDRSDEICQGISDAFYCFECTRLEKDRDGCPKIINLGSSRTDLFYQKKNFRNH